MVVVANQRTDQETDMRQDPARHSVTIRRAFPDDDAALRRLAALDSARPLHGDVLVAESDGELRAAVALTSGTAVADPFHRTADLVDLLKLQADRAAAAPAPRPSRRRLALAVHAR